MAPFKPESVSRSVTALTTAGLQQAALGTYAWVNRRGWLKGPIMDRAFCQAYFLYKRYVEDPYQELAQRHPELFHQALAMDVGANIGYTATVFADAVGRQGEVVAFEPDPANFTRLVAAARRSRGRIQAHQLAVGRAPGEVALWHNAAHHADHRILTQDLAREHPDRASTARPIPMTSVDHFLASRSGHSPTRPLFIKIDVQGYEAEVCAGMEDTLRVHRSCTVAIEYAPTELSELGFAPDLVLDFFESRGFERYVLTRGSPLKRISRDQLERLLRERPYVDLVYLR